VGGEGGGGGGGGRDITPWLPTCDLGGWAGPLDVLREVSGTNTKHNLQCNYSKPLWIKESAKCPKLMFYVWPQGGSKTLKH
jgi:hypothetical protein